MNLYDAHNQWANRPADERFGSLEEMLEATRTYASHAKEAARPFDALRVRAEGNDLYLDGHIPAMVTHHAFTQLATLCQAPPDHYRKLPATLAAQNLNYLTAHRLINVPKGAEFANLLYHQNASTVLRAITTEKYSRIWNYEVIERLIRLRDEQGWQVPPARPARQGQPGVRRATEFDVLPNQTSGGGGLSVNVGDWIAPAGLYASDHDMFAFMVNERVRIDDGTSEGLARGFFVRQSEVGDLSFWVQGFYYRHVCGNHIVWGATNIVEIKLKHVGSVRDAAFPTMVIELKRYADRSAKQDQNLVKSARILTLGAKKADVIDAIFKLKVPELSKKRIGEAYQLAEQHSDSDGAPNTIWGIVQGITRLSQQTTHADARHLLDSAAGKVLSIAAD